MRSASLYALAAALMLCACDSLPTWMGGDDKPEVKLPGDRIAVLEYQRDLIPDAALAERPVSVLKPERNANWRYEASVLAEGIENLAVTGLHEGASASVGEGNGWSTVLVSQPVADGGVVFAMDALGYVSAHRAADIGEVAWVSEAAVTPDEDPIQGGGLAASDGVVYVTTGYGAVMALVAKDGSLLWRQELDIPIRSAPVVAESKVFATTIDNQLLAFDARTGKQVWSHRGIKETSVYLGAVSPAVENGIVVAAYTSGELYGLRADDGSVIWTDSLVLPRRTSAASSLTGIDATPIIRSGAVYALSNNGLMVANVLANGRGLWDLEVAGHQTPWAGGDYIFALTAEASLIAVEHKSGAVRWVRSLRVKDDGVDVTPRYAGPVLVNSRLAVVSDAGEMLLIDPDNGKIAKRIEIDDGVLGAPMVADGRMYLLSSDARLRVYE